MEIIDIGDRLKAIVWPDAVSITETYPVYGTRTRTDNLVKLSLEEIADLRVLLNAIEYYCTECNKPNVIEPPPIYDEKSPPECAECGSKKIGIRRVKAE